MEDKLRGAQKAKMQIIDESWPTDELEPVPACLVCSSSASELLYEDLWDSTAFSAPGYWTLWRCNKCRTAYLNPRPSARSIGRAYQSYYTHSDGAERVTTEGPSPVGLRSRLANGYRNWRFGTNSLPASKWGKLFGTIFPILVRSSNYKFRFLPITQESEPKVLDVGCGGGGWLAQMADTRWQLYGADPDVNAVEQARSKGLHVKQGGIEAWKESESTFHAITMSHVIEHVHDPRDLLARSLKLLVPEGQLYVETPNIDALGHAYFKRSWRGLEPPRHLILFNAVSLATLLHETGFRNIRLRGIPSPIDFIFMASNELRSREKVKFSASFSSCVAEGLVRRWSKLTWKRAEFLAITAQK